MQLNDEEFKLPSVVELKVSAKWQHEGANVLKSGRIIHKKPAAEGDKGSDELLDDLIKDDPYLPRLQSIADDEKEVKNEEEIEKWNFKVVGDTQEFKKGDETIQNCTLIVRCQRWPGSYCVARKSDFANVYIGYGIKRNGNNFMPTSPGEVESDPVGLTEFPEPFPEHEEEKPEPDTDDVKEQDEISEN